MMKKKMDLVCPTCGEKIFVTDYAFICRNCENQWPIKDEIPSFVMYDDSDGLFSRKVLRDLTNRLLHHPWKLAMSEHPSELINKYLLEVYQVDHTNLELLISSLKNEGVALEFGTRMGNLTRVLSETMREVITIDQSPEWLSLVKKIFEQERIGNVSFIKSDLNMIPVPSESIDMILINFLMNEAKLTHLKDSFFHQMHKIYNALKSGGILCLGIENDLSLIKFFGVDSEKKLQSKYDCINGIYSLFQKINEKKLLYTFLRNIEGVLNKFDFQEKIIYGVFPNHRYPKFILQIDTDVISYFYHDFLKKDSSSIKNVYYKLFKVVKREILFFSSFILIAKK